MGLLYFPDELLLLVAENLEDARDLSSLLRTNTRLAFTLSPLLCKLAAAPKYATKAIYYAAANRDADMVRYILEKGATIGLANLDGEKIGDEEKMCSKDIVDFVVKKGANLVLNNNDNNGDFRAINWAAWNRKLAMTKFLVSRGADITFVPTTDDESLLSDAIKGGEPEIVEFLLDNGLSMEINDYFETGLHVAAQVGQLLMAQLLVDRGINISSHNGDGETALHCAVTTGKVEMVELLLRNKANPNIGAKFGGNILPLHIAAQNKGYDIVRLLLSHGADINATDSEGRTALSFAVSAEDEQMVKLLLDKTADIRLDDYHGATPLHFACEKPDIPMVKLLLDNGADINAQDGDLWTPLHWAGQHVNVVNFLVERGAKVTLKTKSGHMPLDLVRENENICAILGNAARAASVDV
ncbi:ankyrin repeat-containing domain protein [Tuber indicum]|nr:ankyrin repeat-containing domain protein [Tuber indicum]